MNWLVAEESNGRTHDVTDKNTHAHNFIDDSVNLIRVVRTDVYCMAHGTADGQDPAMCLNGCTAPMDRCSLDGHQHSSAH